MDPHEQLQAIAVAFASLKKDMDDIKSHLKDKVPWLPIEEAIEGFEAYLEENTRQNTQKGYRHFLRVLGKAFPGRNVADIPASELQGFLGAYWGDKKRTTLKRAAMLLKWFYTWSIKYCQKHGRPPFVNPCEFIEVKAPPAPERPRFTPAKTIGAFLETASNERQWLAFAILATAGLRASELVGDPAAGKSGLLRKDVMGRVLTIRAPKSRREEEIAVIPEWVSEKLERYLAPLQDDDRVIDICYATLHNAVIAHSKMVGQRFTPHYLRKWLVTFWNNMGRAECADFVLRHHSGLRERYIALPMDMIKERQDEHLSADLLGVPSAPPPPEG